MYNKVTLIGRLGRDPELRYTQSSKPVCGFSLAVDGGSKDSTEWVNIVAWEKTAENCGKYLQKGSTVAVEGRLQTRQWEDDNGNKRRKTEVIAARVVFLDSKPKGDSNNQQQHSSSNVFGGQEIPFNEDEIPF